MRTFFRSLLLAILLLLFGVFVASVLLLIIKNIDSQNGIQSWRFTSIDTMKYSRDDAKNPASLNDIPFYVKAVADLGATHIAIDTPYNEEFYPVLKAWVTEARKRKLKIWFRGNFAQWEGWFNYPTFSDVNEHHTLTKAFIEKHPDLFEKDDIFTPVPEAENGGFGDPRGSIEKSKEFNNFLIASYDNCVASFKKINIPVHCGYFSTNGDIAKQVLTPDTVKKIGDVVVIDHYVDSAKQMSDDLDYLANKFPGAKIVLGEFGAPIPDINGQMTEKEQATFVDQILTVLEKHKDTVTGVNYWGISGGGTAIYNEDKTIRLVGETIKNHFTTLNKN